KPRSRGERIAAQLDRIMDQGDVHMAVNVNKLIYHNFIADNINAEVTLKQSDILLQNVRVSHAGGTLKLKANIDQKGPVNRSNVTFADLENTLDIKGSKIIIRPMHIQSSAITFNVEGIYALKTGTDIFIDVSMRNPEKDELLADGDLKTERSMKGIIMHLRAI